MSNLTKKKPGSALARVEPRKKRRRKSKTTHADIGPVPGCSCFDCSYLRSPGIGSLFGAIHSFAARLVVGPQVDDVVTDAVKESYAQGVEAALEEARRALRASVLEKRETTIVLDDAKLDALFAEIPKRLAGWKVKGVPDGEE
jgi:hypothetical protein